MRFRKKPAQLKSAPRCAQMNAPFRFPRIQRAMQECRKSRPWMAVFGAITALSRCRSDAAERASKARLFERRDARVRAGAREARSKGSRGNRTLPRPSRPAPMVLATFAETKVARSRQRAKPKAILRESKTGLQSPSMDFALSGQPSVVQIRSRRICPAFAGMTSGIHSGFRACARPRNDKEVIRSAEATHAICVDANSQFTTFQNASMYFGRALR